MKYNTDKVVTLNGKEYILFEGLLECAHYEYDLDGIDTDLIQKPTEENGHEAIVKAVVVTKDGKKFSAYGDANPQNVNSKIRPHIIRMAETRAVGRALRFLTGYGTVFEELGEEVEEERKPQEKQEQPLATRAQINKIQKDAKKLGLTIDDVYKKFNITSEKMTRKDASDIIKWLQSQEKEQAQAPF